MHRLKNWQLFAICALAWGTTWHAITYQLGGLAPEWSVAARFALAGLTIVAMCAWRGLRLRFTWREHAVVALQGCFLYGVSYVCVYRAEEHIASGLVAVGYSTSPLVSGIGAMWLFGAALTRRFVFGGVLGLLGVALIFWPEFMRPSNAGASTLGAAFTVGSVLLSTIGSLVASRNRKRGLPFWPALGMGMLYGAGTSVVVALIAGRHLVLPSTPSWWFALLYLAFAGSVMTFACFLTLQERVGPGRAGTIGVMTPLLALIVSMLFEGYRPDALAAAGAALAVLGNVFMLSGAGRGAATAKSALQSVVDRADPRAAVEPDAVESARVTRGVRAAE